MSTSRRAERKRISTELPLSTSMRPTWQLSLGRNLGAPDMACLMCLLINEYESPECGEPPIMAPMVFFMGGTHGGIPSSTGRQLLGEALNSHRCMTSYSGEMSNAYFSEDRSFLECLLFCDPSCVSLRER
ncbi:hypothetical protein TIFTF001_016862 [Ficus carica]|uniref:Uncharacterized protein n=1 Tax=Ficus carica TaxID=3494 RepID=A0AA88A722_FICCA|nr:hypothetical protein TIFTF001_016862 [Ficus carica]